MRNYGPPRRLVLWFIWIAILALIGLSRSPHLLLAQGQPEDLLLGQAIEVDLPSGGTAMYHLELPQDGTYVVTVIGGKAAPFHITMTDPEGRMVLDDDLDAVEGEPLDLQAGLHTITLSTEDGGAVAFMWLGLQVGSLSRDEKHPGRLYPGSTVTVDRLDAAYTARLEIPESPYPQLVVVSATPEESEEEAQPLILWVRDQMEGVEIIASADNEDDPTAPAVTTFWTAGGPFQVAVFPLSLLTTGQPPEKATAVRVEVSLGPPALIRSVGDTWKASLPAVMDLDVYPLELDAFYRQVTVTLTWDDPAVDLDLAVAEPVPTSRIDPAELATTRIYNGVWGVSRQTSGTREEVTLEGLLPGPYLIVASRSDGFNIPVDSLVFSIDGEPGEPPVALTVNEPISREIKAGDVLYFRFDGEVGQAFRVLAESDDPDVGLYLYVGLRPGAVPVAISDLLFGHGTPSQELSFVAPTAGTYYIEVRNFGESGPFRLLVESSGPPPTLSPNDAIRGVVDGEEPASFVLPVETAGGFLGVLLVGEENADLDLELTLSNDRAETQISESDEGAGPYKVVYLTQAPAGHYLVRVRARAAEEPVHFTLITRLETPQELTQASLEVTNEGDFNICQITATPADIDEEPLDLLEEPLAPGETITVTLPAGHYNLADYDCEDTQLDELKDVVLQGPMQLTVP